MTRIMQIVSGILMSLTLAAVVHASAADREAEVAERMKPVGEACIEGDASCAGATASAGGGEARSGSAVYDASCAMCHGAGVAGAPKVGDAAAWADRIAKGKDTLYNHALNGFQAMPPRGTCMNCSDDEIKAAVDHMVAASE